MTTIDPEKYAALELENQKLKAENQQIKLSYAIEKAFFEAGGKQSSALDEFTFLDMVAGHASKFIKVDDQGRTIIIDPRDGSRMRTNTGENYSLKDLMDKFKKSLSSPLANCFDKSSGSGATKNLAQYETRESLREIKDPAARLARSRELGIK